MFTVRIVMKIKAQGGTNMWKLQKKVHHPIRNQKFYILMIGLIIYIRIKKIKN